MPIVIAALFLLAAQTTETFGPDARFQLEYSRDGFGSRSHGVVEQLTDGRTQFYPLPQSTAKQYIQLRPFDVQINRFTLLDIYERQEVIGPHQFDAGRLWFGNNFYDGEGSKGVGAFGYFDTATRKYALFSPPEVASCEISALLVEHEIVWVALDHFGEDISTFPCGLVRWNAGNRQTERYPLEFNIGSIRREGRALRLTTQSGYAFFENGELRRFLSNGQPINKFPPPPSHF